MYLPDINVWLALTFEAHVHHRVAVKWFETLTPRSGAFCRFTQQGFLRLASNPTVMKEDAVTMSRAWECYDAFLNDARIFYLEEPSGLEGRWRRHTCSSGYSHKIWGDAYLAGFAGAAGLIPVTFDRGFAAFDDVETLILGERT